MEIPRKFQARSLLELPVEILLHIFSFADYRDICRSAQTCRQLKNIAADETLWRKQAEKCFLVKLGPEDDSWISTFQSYYKRFGKDIPVYQKVRRTWNRLEDYLKVNDPRMLDSLRDPACLDEIKIAEQKIKGSLPGDLRCSLQIHNGQEMNRCFGLLGCMKISSYFRSEVLLDCASMARGYNEDDSELPGCAALTFCFFSRKAQYIALKDIGGFQVGEIFYPTPDNSNQTKTDHFITGYSFLEWFVRFVDDLESGAFPRLNEKIYRISMDSRADKCLSCQLETRHWIITDDEGREERVDGPGVVGEYPIMTPGAEYSWISCTTFSTTYGNMRGHFTMRCLENGQEIDIECPVFHMKCLPYKTHRDRQQYILQRKKNL
ncbi:hypothetical protein C0Q70_11630 [Pomacea canaliculata]|uniref:F-box domain-containing protein n=1 Tax=Pomacea canaliculata TaxID=400727 RepID=A0A2T7P6L1_POMCA|nr:hypothetical protein C0Q70_11630 [Pomacea canaliculata]